jgi:hypothetical protein
MSLFDHVKAGDPVRLRAPVWNSLLDAAKARQGEVGFGAESRPGRDIVLVKNTSGADRERFDILGVDAPVFTPAESAESFKNQVALKGITPTAADHVGRFVVLLEPAKASAIVPGLLAGVSAVHVNVTDEDHAFADVADGQCGYLASGTTGAAQILWKETGTGVKWAVVRVGPAYRRGCWARLVSEASGGGGYYSWKMLEDDAETPVDPPVTGTDNAKEVNGTTGIPTGETDGTVVWLERDAADDEWRFAYEPGGGGGPIVVRIVSYSSGVYTVQPVVRSGGAWQDVGAPLPNIHNFGEVQAEEAGYLAGPTGCDIYVPLFEAGDERFLLVHPPRMV